MIESGDVTLTSSRSEQIEDVRELAWALKDICYGAWSSEPQRAARTADALRSLSDGTARSREAQPIKYEVEALACWTSGIAHITRGEMNAAVGQFDAAAELFMKLDAKQHAAYTQVPKIMALSMLGRYDDAAACAVQAQRTLVAVGDSHAAGKVSLNLGALHERRGAYADAARESRSAAVLFARVGDHEHSVMADINMANALTALGDFDEAMRIYARARMRAETHGFPVLDALAAEAVALLQLAQGNYRDALAGFESTRRRYEQLAMPQHVAIVEKQLADAYLELHLLPEALALFDQVIERFAALNIPDELAWTFAQRGRLLTMLAKPLRANESFEQAAALFAEQSNGVGEAAVALARAELALASKDASGATALATAAAERFAAAGRADGRCRAALIRAMAALDLGDASAARDQFAATLIESRELQLLTVQVRCLTGQGLAAVALGDEHAAEASFRGAVELFEEQRRALPGDDLRSAFLTDHLRPFEELLRIALRAHERKPSSASATQVLQQLERFRARTLGERIDQHGKREHSKTELDLRERLNWLYRRVQRLEEEGDPSAPLVNEMHRLERELLEGARRVRLAMPSPFAKIDEEFDLGALQRLLSKGDALVEYGVLGNELFACVVTSTEVQLRRHVACWSEVANALRAARFQIDALRHGAAPVSDHLLSLTQRAQRRMQQLHALVWAPLLDLLSDRTRVLLVPHQQLGELPFAALYDGAGSVGERWSLAMVPSARLAMRGLAHQPRQPQAAVVIGETSRLPHAAGEARFVAGLFANSRLLTDQDATLTALRTHAAEADVLHLACHGQFRADNPTFSSLQLFDSTLTTELAESLALRAGSTVVLSACETGLSQFADGNESVGMVRAFLVAGGARVLASLWTVDDAVTATFMATFYSALRDGSAPAAAVHMAQVALMRTHPHPFYWAAFTLHGGW